METIFNLVNVIVLPFWILMIGLPKWKWTERIINSAWIAFPIAAIYAVLLISSMASGELIDFTLDGIVQGLGNPMGATVGWAHFLAFDLLVGRWIFLDSREKKHSVWVMGVILLFVFMAGPMGYLLYLILNLLRR